MVEVKQDSSRMTSASCVLGIQYPYLFSMLLTNTMDNLTMVAILLSNAITTVQYQTTEPWAAPPGVAACETSSQHAPSWYTC